MSTKKSSSSSGSSTSTSTSIVVRPVPSKYSSMEFTAEHVKHSRHARQFIKRYARIMDKRGADALLGLLGPLFDIGLGVTHSAVTLYWAFQVNLPPATITKILARHGVDVVVGFVPVIGDLLDFGIRSNLYAQEQFDMHHDYMIQHMIDQGVSLDENDKQSSGAPSERFSDRSIEGLWKQAEQKIDGLFESKTDTNTQTKNQPEASRSK